MDGYFEACEHVAEALRTGKIQDARSYQMIRERYSILGSNINCTNMDDAIRAVHEGLAAGGGGYVCFCNVHLVVSAIKDSRLREIINSSYMAMPDGRPLSVFARLQGVRRMTQVAGPDFMPRMMRDSPDLRHYLFGSTPDIIRRLRETISQEFPGAHIVGSHSPPVRDIGAIEPAATIESINSSSPDIVWVALGAPKQEYWMAAHYAALKPAILMGVGAAFDFLAGAKPRAPKFLRTIGMEWAYRLATEPRRLWRRYLVTNTQFVYRAARELISLKRSSGKPRSGL